MLALRYLDLLILLAALPVFILLDLPLLGYAAGAGVWLVQRGIQELVSRRVAREDDPRAQLGMNAASVLGRGWLVALTILLVGLRGNDEAGLAAAVLVILLFTLHFPFQFLSRPAAKPATRKGQATG